MAANTQVQGPGVGPERPEGVVPEPPIPAAVLREVLLSAASAEHGFRAISQSLTQPDAPVVVRGATIEGDLDLSFCSVPHGLVLVECDLVGRLALEGATLPGLQLHRCTDRGADLRRAHVTGDLKLTARRPVPPGSEAGAATVPVAAAPTRAEAHHWYPVLTAGAVVDGDLDLSGAHLSYEEEEGLAAAAARGARAPVGSTPPFAVNWELVLQSVGLTAGLAAWIAVVGGARLWARMESAHAPALPTLAGLGQGWMVAEGLQTLLLPILLGSVVSLLVYFSRWEGRLSDASAADSAPSGLRAARGSSRRLHVDRARPLVAARRLLDESGSSAAVVVGTLLGALLATSLLVVRASLEILIGTGVLLVIVAVVGKRWGRGSKGRTALLGLVVATTGLLLSLVVSIELPGLLFMGLVTAVSVWLTLGALLGKTPRAAAVTVFVAIVAWSGALGFTREAAARAPDLPRARVELRDGGPPVGGYLLGRSSSHVFLAQDPIDQGEAAEPEDGDVERHVVTIAEDDVERLTYGNSIVLPEAAREKGGEPDPWWRRWWERLPSYDGGGQQTAADTADSDRDAATTGVPPGETEGVRPGGRAPGPGGRPADGGAGGVPADGPPFDPVPRVAHRDRVVGTDAVRLELYPLQRNGDVVYVQVQVTDMSGREQDVSDVLALDRGAFDTVVLVDPDGQRMYEVSRHDGGCGCSEGLQGAAVPPYGSRWLWATFVVQDDPEDLDVLVPPFATFPDVPVR